VTAVDFLAGETSWPGRSSAIQKKPRARPRMCEGCGLRHPHFGYPNERKKRWCQGCSQQFEGAERLCKGKMCADCGKTTASMGPSGTRHKTWCGPCGHKHPGAVSMARHKMCEDCGLKGPTFGLRAPGQVSKTSASSWRRWCAGCKVNHEGAERLSKMCEDCGGKQPSWGLPAMPKNKRWCAGCGKQHEGAFNILKKCLANSKRKMGAAAAERPDTAEFWVDKFAKVLGVLPASLTSTRRKKAEAVYKALVKEVENRNLLAFVETQPGARLPPPPAVARRALSPPRELSGGRPQSTASRREMLDGSASSCPRLQVAEA
jgi:hypothetical protein